MGGHGVKKWFDQFFCQIGPFLEEFILATFILTLPLLHDDWGDVGDEGDGSEASKEEGGGEEGGGGGEGEDITLVGRTTTSK